MIIEHPYSGGDYKFWYDSFIALDEEFLNYDPKYLDWTVNDSSS